jgi:hypothetical protein
MTRRIEPLRARQARIGALAAAAQSLAGVRVHHGRHLRDAILDVRDERLLRPLPVARERTFEKNAVLVRRNRTAKDRRDHLVAKIFVAYRRVRFQQHARVARGNQCQVECPVVAPPRLRRAWPARMQLLLGRRQHVMRRDDASFPRQVAALERLLHAMAFEQLAHRGDLAQVRRRHCGHLEAARAFGDEQTLGRKTIEELPQRADAGAVRVAHAVERQFPARRQTPQDDVGTDAPVRDLAHAGPRFRHGCRLFGGHHSRPGGSPPARPNVGGFVVHANGALRLRNEGLLFGWLLTLSYARCSM